MGSVCSQTFPKHQDKQCEDRRRNDLEIKALEDKYAKYVKYVKYTGESDTSNYWRN